MTVCGAAVGAGAAMAVGCGLVWMDDAAVARFMGELVAAGRCEARLVDALLADLHGMEGVERAEELADLMPHMDDEDSSSAGLMDDRGGDVRVLEIEVLSPHADRVREAAADIAGQYGLVLEFVDDF